MKNLNKYLQHLSSCNKMQDWTEALSALSDSPDGIDKIMAGEELFKKMSTCTCGLDNIVIDRIIRIVFKESHPYYGAVQNFFFDDITYTGKNIAIKNCRLLDEKGTDMLFSLTLIDSFEIK